MCSLQLRILQAVGNLQAISIKGMDGRTAVNHPGNSINSRDSFGMEKEEKCRDGSGSFLVDIFLSKVKIVYGFYQVTYGLLETFSYIQWPDSLRIIGKYSEILQLNVLQTAPVDCLFSGLHMNAFGNLIAMMTVNAGVIGISGVSYGVHRQIILKAQKLGSVEKMIKISQSKELVYRNVFFFLYATYLSTCSKTANVLPLACWRLCRDDKEDFCYKYLIADYSIQCRGLKYKHFLIVSYISMAPCCIIRQPLETTKSYNSHRKS